jgi:hypothetical protein
MRSIKGTVYKADNLGDTTNNGISSRRNILNLVFGEDLDIKSLNDDDLVLTEFEHGGVRTLRAVPVSLIRTDKWYMFGGNFVYSSTSDFPSNQPIKIFDRIEE